MLLLEKIRKSMPKISQNNLKIVLMIENDNVSSIEIF